MPDQSKKTTTTSKASKKLLITIGISLIIIGALYFLISEKLHDYRMSNIRKGYIESYAGCEIKRFNLAVTEPDPKEPRLTVGVDNVNKYWKKDSQEWHFDHADVVAYMMEHCPPRSEEYFEEWRRRSQDIKFTEKSIVLEKKIRSYQLKFINKDLDIFQD